MCSRRRRRRRLCFRRCRRHGLCISFLCGSFVGSVLLHVRLRQANIPLLAPTINYRPKFDRFGGTCCFCFPLSERRGVYIPVGLLTVAKLNRLSYTIYSSLERYDSADGKARTETVAGRC